MMTYYVETFEMRVSILSDRVGEYLLEGLLEDKLLVLLSVSEFWLVIGKSSTCHHKIVDGSSWSRTIKIQILTILKKISSFHNKNLGHSE